MTSTVTIVGGGIGGLAVAAALSSKGAPIEVLEGRFVISAPGGAALAMAPNAMWVLRRLGMADEVQNAASRITRYEFRDGRGRVLNAVDMRPLSSPWGESAWCVPRGHILSVLKAHLDPEIITSSAAVDSVAVDTGRFAIHLADGVTKTASALIGCDGAHSVVRQCLWPAASDRIYQGFVAARGTLHWTVPASQQETVVQMWGPGGEFGYAPMGPGEVYWFATMAWPSADAALPTRDTLLSHFAQWSEPAASLIAATPAEQLLLHPIYDRLSPFAPRPDAVTLVGDAAHLMTPNTGQGACQALLDAWVLAQQWPLNDASIPAALAAYRRIRLPHALRVARWSRTLGRAIHRSGNGYRWFRDALVARTPESTLRAGMAGVLGTPESLHLR